MQDNEGKILVGITMGDINGIGPELIIKIFEDNRMLQVCTPVIYGSGKVLNYYRKSLNVKEFYYNTIKSIDQVQYKKLNLINCLEDEPMIEVGVATDAVGKYAFNFLKTACQDLQDGKLDALVTAPINKATMQQEGFRYPGHTEYLADTFKSNDSLMILMSGSLRVTFVTGHVAVKNIADNISKEIILKKLKSFNDSLKKDFRLRKPMIAVLGLNPHSGDNGLLGNEEKEIIIPAIKEAFESGIMAYGPFSADGLFGSANFNKYDGVLAMYHDQGIVPFKTMAFNTGVNFTGGLSIVRTSPDHGTAYDIAGKGIADESSFREAIYAAIDICQTRMEFEEINSNPLKFTKHNSDR
ncbi:MAG TPA: 4-hydroxythreonine-4-phosphate dehydrogenase PdxA [Bacteroidia bacterium]|nr:4-hydroxythreonine-4-phosphate dehydrogenase PdxA [Bacteroidia bacterium]HNT81091.1 4-hydroxythreonine-4-phosphate dehydrogenase PdxA [Bacteroidia bacterium]